MKSVWESKHFFSAFATFSAAAVKWFMCCTIRFVKPLVAFRGSSSLRWKWWAFQDQIRPTPSLGRRDAKCMYKRPDLDGQNVNEIKIKTDKDPSVMRGFWRKTAGSSSVRIWGALGKPLKRVERGHPRSGNLGPLPSSRAGNRNMAFCHKWSICGTGWRQLGPRENLLARIHLAACRSQIL